MKSSSCFLFHIQPTALNNPSKCISFDETRLLLQRLFHSKFTYCPLTCHFSSLKSLKIEHIPGGTLLFLLKDNTSPLEHLPEKLNKNYMHVSHFRAFYTEVYK